MDHRVHSECALGQLLLINRHYVFRNDISGHDCQTLEQILVRVLFDLRDVIDQNLLFLGVLFEVRLERLVADKRLLKFNHLLALHIFVVERVDDGLHSTLEPVELVPHHGNALEEVFSVVVL